MLQPHSPPSLLPPAGASCWLSVMGSQWAQTAQLVAAESRVEKGGE